MVTGQPVTCGYLCLVLFQARDLENKRTVQQLLALRGGALDGEVSYFFREPPEQPMISDKTGYKDAHNQKLRAQHGRGV